MIKTRLNTLFVLALLLLIGVSKANEPLLDSAKANYDNNDFTIAIEQYESIKIKGLTSPDLYYNLGNAYFRNGQLGYSILNFEKAIKANPAHENAKFNLELANTKLADKFEIIPQASISKILVGINNGISHNLISIISVIILLLGTGFFLYAKKEKNRKLIKYSRLLVLFGALITLIAWQQKSAVEKYKAGITLSSAANIFSAPNPSSTLLFEIHEGTKLEILSKSGDWLNVKAPNNEIGWVEVKSIGEI